MSIQDQPQFHRPFERTGFVPLPQKLKKKLNKLTPSIVTNKPNMEEIQRIYDIFCQDCRDDCYEDKLNQILLYKLTSQYSLRLINIRNIRVRQQQEYIIAKNAQMFTLYRCQNGTYHLYRKNHKVLMVRQAFRLVAKVHGQYHHDGQTMKKIITTQYPYISSFYLKQFLMQFPLMCPYCRQFPSLESSFMPTPKSRIWFYLEPTRIDYEDDGDQNEILTYSRPSAHFPHYISPNIRSIQQVIQQLKKFSKMLFSNLMDNVNMCNPNGSAQQNCVTDEYESQYLIILYVYKQNKYPLLRSNSQIGRLIQAARYKIRQIQVRICNLGTPHLWHKQRNQRILMKDQISMVLSKLHNGSVAQSQIVNEEGRGLFHRNQKLMRYILEKETAIYPYNIIGSMKTYLNRCQVCCKKKVYRQYKRPQIQFQNSQMAIFRSKLQEDRKRYKEALQIPKNLSYDQLIQKKQVMKTEHKKIQGVQQGKALDQNDMHPNDKQNSTEVQQMVRSFSNYPQMVQFFSNDLMWLIQFNDKKYPDYITDGNIQIKKYAYDGMYRIIFISTQSMRRNYYTYGQCLCIDFIPMMLKRRSPSGRHFQVGFLTGMDQNNSSVLFGVCFMSEDLMIYHRKMFDFFFESVKQVIPGTIITSSGKNLSQAVYLMKKQDPFKYKFNHYYGWFYVVQDLKRDLSGEYDRAQMLKQFCNLLVQANPISHQKRLIQITSQIVQRTILHKFLKEKNKYCLSCLPPAFMGFAMETKRVQDFYQLLTQNFIYQGKVAQFMYYIFEFEKKLNNKTVRIDNAKNLQIITEILGTKIKEQEQNNDLEVSEEMMLQLAQLSQVLGESVLRNLMKNFVQAQKLVIIQEQDALIRGESFDAFFIDSDNLKYSVRYSTQDDCWRCSCPWVYWTGVPCCHILKMVMKQGGDLIYYINSRWIVQPGQQQALQPESKIEISQYRSEVIDNLQQNERSVNYQSNLSSKRIKQNNNVAAILS